MNGTAEAFEALREKWDKLADERGDVCVAVQPVPTPAKFDRKLATPHDVEKLTAAWKLTSKTRRGVCVYGGVGNGKTTWARSVLGIETGSDRAKMLEMGDTHSGEWLSGLIGYEDSVYNKATLLLDDVGAERRASEYGRIYEPFAEYVYYRYSLWERGAAGKLFITTNLTPSQMTERYGERTADRLNAMCVFAHMTGESHRGKTEELA